MNLKKMSTKSLDEAGCLSEHTRVYVFGQGYVPASEVLPGSWLVAGRIGGGSEATAVRAVKRFVSTDFVQINGCIEVTDNHPFLTTAGTWVSAADLKGGDNLAGLDGIIRIEKIAVLRKPSTTVIDIITDDPYVAEGFVTTAKSVFLATKATHGVVAANCDYGRQSTSPSARLF